MGLIGCGERGSHDIGRFQTHKDIAVCDIYGAKIDAAQQKAARARAFTDHREELDAAGNHGRCSNQIL